MNHGLFGPRNMLGALLPSLVLHLSHGASGHPSHLQCYLPDQPEPPSGKLLLWHLSPSWSWDHAQCETSLRASSRHIRGGRALHLWATCKLPKPIWELPLSSSVLKMFLPEAARRPASYSCHAASSFEHESPHPERPPLEDFSSS